MKIASLVCDRRRWTSLSLAIALFMISGFATAQSRDSRDKANWPLEALEALKSDEAAARVAAAKFLIKEWQSSLAVLIPELSALNHEKELSNFRAITDVLRSIVLNFGKEGAVQKFRSQANEQTIRSLAWAARSSDAGLRINATYILASVVDNTNLCIVLHHLRDKTMSADGRINLLQVATAVAGYAYKENVDAIRETAKENVDAIRETAKNVRNNVANEKDVALTQELLKDLSQRADQSKNNEISLLTEPANPCKGYNYNDPLKR